MGIFKLVGDIFVNNEKADKSLDGTDSKAEKVGKTFQKTIKIAGNFGKVAAIGIGAGATAMVALASKTGDAADRLLDLNSITGMSTDEIQKWERVTTVAGVSADAMTNVSQKLTKQMDILSTGTGKASESAAKLGLSYDVLDKMNPDERMNALVTALGSVEDKQERARLGTDLLGGSWKDLAPILDVGAERLQEVKNNANIISNEDLNQANEFRIKMDQMKERVTVLGQELAVKFIPVLNKMFEWITENMPTIEKVFTATFNFISTVTEKVIDIISNVLIPTLQTLWEWIEPHIPMIQEFFRLAFENIKIWIEAVWLIVQDHLIPILTTLFAWVEKNLPVFKEIFKTTFNIIKTVVEGVWSILEVTLFPVLKTIFKWAGDNMPLFQVIFETAFGAINKAVEFTQGVIEGIITTITDMIDAIKEGLKFLGDFNEADKPGTPQGKAKDSGSFKGFASGTNGPLMKPVTAEVFEHSRGEIIELPSGTVVTPLNGRQPGALMGGAGTSIVVQPGVIAGRDGVEEVAEMIVEILRERGIGQ